jgi:hypothetical protein
MILLTIMTLMKVSQSEEHITAFGDHMEKNFILFSAKRQSVKPFPDSRCVYYATCPARPFKKISSKRMLS